MARALRSSLAATLVASLLLADSARAEELPPRNQALILLRLLAYDRNLKRRAGPVVQVVLLFRPGDKGSEERRESLLRAFQEVAQDVLVVGLPVKVEALPYRDGGELDTRLGVLRPALAYVDSALEPVTRRIAQTTRRHGVLTAGGARAMVEAGIAIGVVPRARRAGVIVSLEAARLEGADLDAGLLAISEVIPE